MKSKGRAGRAGRAGLTGRAEFESFYSGIYGERWQKLKEALLCEREPVSLSERLSVPYYMDRASVLVSGLLPVREGNTVLDMCAAPGGKTLSIALRLNGHGVLISNDRSASRRGRLKKVISDCLPRECRETVTVTGHDAGKWCLYEKNVYDAVLLDAPCSSERHVLADEKELAKWSLNRPKTLAATQYTMLSSALSAVRNGGYILYSTCSINPNENTGVIERLMKKKPGKAQIIDFSGNEYGERLQYGNIIMPDTDNGSGPLYFCLLRRTNEPE